MTPNPINALKLTIHKHTPTIHQYISINGKREDFENFKFSFIHYISNFHKLNFIYFAFLVLYICIYIYKYTILLVSRLRLVLAWGRVLQVQRGLALRSASKKGILAPSSR